MTVSLIIGVLLVVGAVGFLLRDILLEAPLSLMRHWTCGCNTGEYEHYPDDEVSYFSTINNCQMDHVFIVLASEDISE